MLRRILVLLLPLALLASACSDDKPTLTAQEQRYADAFAKDLADKDDGFGVDAKGGQCIGEAIMRILSVKPFKDAGVEPKDLAGDESPGELLGEGVVTDDQAKEITVAWNRCVDLANIFAKQAQQEFKLDGAGLSCFKQQLRDSGILDKYLVVSFTKADHAAGTAVLQRIVSLVQHCSTSKEGQGGVLVESIAASLAEDGKLTIVQGRCMAQALVDQVGADRLIVLTGNGNLSSVPAEGQQEFAKAVFDAANACGVPLTDLGS